MMKASDVFLLSLPLQVWNTNTGEELLTLEGHRNVVYAIAFENHVEQAIARVFLQEIVISRRQSRDLMTPITAAMPTSAGKHEKDAFSAVEDANLIIDTGAQNIDQSVSKLLDYVSLNFKS